VGERKLEPMEKEQEEGEVGLNSPETTRAGRDNIRGGVLGDLLKLILNAGTEWVTPNGVDSQQRRVGGYITQKR